MTGVWQVAAMVGFAVLYPHPSFPQGTALVLPSGVEAVHHDTIFDEDMAAIRLRFIVPRLSEPSSLYAGDAMRVFEDMLWLCETQIAAGFFEGVDPRDEGWSSAVISLMATPLEFGARDASVFQLFEWFDLTMDGCELEMELYHE